MCQPRPARVFSNPRQLLRVSKPNRATPLAKRMALDIPVPWHWSLAAAIVIGYPIFYATYNIYFHPLSNVPGPRLWSAFRLRYVWSHLSGNIVQDCDRLHQKYGHIVRVAPDEVSFARRDVWTDALVTRQGEPQLSKDPRWWDPLPGLPAVGIFGAVDADNHARVRKLLSPAFTPRTLVSQEPILQEYSSLLIKRLREAITSNSEKPLNVVEWFNFTTFDMFGDLLFAESFDCLHHSQYHAWIELLFNYTKSTVYAAVPNYYPWLASAFKKLIPASMKKMIQEHHRFIFDRLDRRFKAVDRPDAMSHIIKQMGIDKTSVSMNQLCTTVMELVTAGSETTATALAAMVNYLIHNTDKLETVTAEIRTRFKEESDIALDALRDEGLYLNAVINEALRMAPPVPWLPPRVIPAGGRTICGTYLPENASLYIPPFIFSSLMFSNSLTKPHLQKTTLNIQIYLMNRDPQYFHSPNTFLPERWLPEAATNPNSPFYNDQRQAVQPFSVGGKACFGQHLAWAEMRLILARFLWAFDIEAAKDKEAVVWEDYKVYVFWDKSPVWVGMKLRD
ncbi:cytochrome P450 [Cladorrhinum sp. PSN332]|nr:cytochrome P450 [Cladorrhinum sp. PSN332]